MTVQETTWIEAYEARAAEVRAHPKYATLFRKVARAEAAMVHPVEYRYRNRTIPVHFDGPNNDPTFVSVGFKKWSRPADEHAGPSTPINDAWAFAESLVPDIFSEDERNRWANGDMVAVVYGPAREDVRARVDPRRPGCWNAR